MKIKKIYAVIVAVLLFGIMFLNACRPIRNLMHPPASWSGTSSASSKLPAFDPGKKTVFIIADHKLTELFDMLAPYYLFNATGKAKVYIVAKEKTPILIKRDLFVCPQLTFREADSMQLHADVVVIPALSIRDEHQDSSVIAFITKHFTAGTKLLTICDGASTGAATGLYDNKKITCHASDLAGIKSHFNKPAWVKNISVTRDGNLFSTAGVSNAVEGSLTVIDELFGPRITSMVMADIHYPYPAIKTAHQSIAISAGKKFTAVRKVFFRRNKDIGILLENGINEFAMASIIDTYGRTLPASFKAYILNDSIIQTKHGLTLISTAHNNVKGLDELHVIMPGAFTKADELYFKNIKKISYDDQDKEYLFNVYLKRIGKQYGHQFESFVKISLDYN